ncbi:MAG: hypothetical protein JWM11_329 [Planctomycetaceae bacterium]|nr:hypothetical protein [Planctomycetaceae bacterium]
MQTATCTTTVGVFSSRAQADKAVDALFDAGFTTGQIGMVTRDEKVAGTTTRPSDEAENAGTGATTGAITGAGVGALVGWGVLSGVIPVIGPALFAGTLGVLASNAAGGAAVAGIAGALTGWGISGEHVQHYESELAAGRTVVTVASSDHCDEARAILKRFGATSKDSWFAS